MNFHNPCSLTKEYYDAYINGVWHRETWFGEDENKMHALLAKYAPLVTQAQLLTTQLSTSPPFFLHSKGCVNFCQKLNLKEPEVVFFQRLSSYTKTFDVLLFYKTEYVEIRAVPKREQAVVTAWCSGMGVPLYNGGVDPLPAALMLDAAMAGETWEAILAAFDDGDEESGSEWEPGDTETESEVEYLSDMDIE